MKEHTKFCTNCGKEIPTTSHFCPFCGAEQVTDDSAATNPESAGTHAHTNGNTVATTVNANDSQNNQQNYQQSGNYQQGPYQNDTVYNESPVPGLVASTLLYLRDFITIDKRMGRADYWWSVLGIALFSIVFWALFGIVFLIPSALGSLQIPVIEQLCELIIVLLFIAAFVIYMALAIANLTAQIRRLHDAGYSGAMWLLNFVPVVGGIIVLVLLCQPSRQFGNQYLYR